MGRREAGITLASVASLVVGEAPGLAAYGQKANVFGERTNDTEYYALSGNGYSVNIPAKFVPTREREFPETDAMFTDSFDTITTLSITRFRGQNHSSVKDYGTLVQLLEQYPYVLGVQSFEGKTMSEGGFSDNKVVTATLVDSKEEAVDGKVYFKYNLLTRTADGDEGGKHQLLSFAVGSDGCLYLYKVCVGEKRWIKGGSKLVLGSWDSFRVA